MAKNRQTSYSAPSYSEIASRNLWKPAEKTKKKKKTKHPKNAVIINFPDGEQITESMVREELAGFGKIGLVKLCTLDACQAFVTFQDSEETRGKDSVKNLLKSTSGVLFVNQFMWTICSPKEWKKLMDSHEDPKSLTGEGITVDELTEIFTNFMRQNSSISQTSLFSNSTQSYSSFSSSSIERSCWGSRSSSSSSPNAESCDSSVTITPFSIFPAQHSEGFLNLPPPYHTLPDTAFFRRTKIVPPPLIKKSDPIQQIMDRYISSFQKSDSETCSTRKRQDSLLELECSWWNCF